MTRTVAVTILLGFLAGTLVFAAVSQFTDDPSVVTAQRGEQLATPAGVSVPQHEAIAAVPFDMRVPRDLPFAVHGSSGTVLERFPGGQEFSTLVLTDVSDGEDIYLEVWQSNIEIISADEGTEIVDLGEQKAYFLDNGITTTLHWYNAAEGISFTLVSGEKENRLPVEALVEIAMNLE